MWPVLVVQASMAMDWFAMPVRPAIGMLPSLVRLAHLEAQQTHWSALVMQAITATEQNAAHVPATAA